MNFLYAVNNMEKQLYGGDIYHTEIACEILSAQVFLPHIAVP